MVFRAVVVRMFDDALADFKREVQPAEGGVALLEILHDAERMQIVVEEQAVLAHGSVESFFSGVSEWRMANIVNQRERFGEIGAEVERSSDGARDLCDFQAVSETVAEVVGIAPRENLRLGFETAKGAGMNHTIAVALKVVAVGMLRLGEAASAGVLDVHGVAGQHGKSLAEGRGLTRVSTQRGRDAPATAGRMPALLPWLTTLHISSLPAAPSARRLCNSTPSETPADLKPGRSLGTSRWDGDRFGPSDAGLRGESRRRGIVPRR